MDALHRVRWIATRAAALPLLQAAFSPSPVSAPGGRPLADSAPACSKRAESPELAEGTSKQIIGRRLTPTAACWPACTAGLGRLAPVVCHPHAPLCCLHLHAADLWGTYREPHNAESARCSPEGAANLSVEVRRRPRLVWHDICRIEPKDAASVLTRRLEEWKTGVAAVDFARDVDRLI